MNMESVESAIYDVTAEFFHGATVIWAEQVNTKPDLPYDTQDWKHQQNSLSGGR